MNPILKVMERSRMQIYDQNLMRTCNAFFHNGNGDLAPLRVGKLRASILVSDAMGFVRVVRTFLLNTFNTQARMCSPLVGDEDHLAASNHYYQVVRGHFPTHSKTPVRVCQDVGCCLFVCLFVSCLFVLQYMVLIVLRVLDCISGRFALAAGPC